MTSKLTLILLITVVSVAAASDTLRQIHDLSAMAVNFGPACFWGDLPTVAATGRESCAMKSFDALDDEDVSQDLETTAFDQRVFADYTFDNCPKEDILVLPDGGYVRKTVDDSDLIEWTQDNAQDQRRRGGIAASKKSTRVLSTR
jgi:hypothetical protein